MGINKMLNTKCGYTKKKKSMDIGKVPFVFRPRRYVTILRHRLW